MHEIIEQRLNDEIKPIEEPSVEAIWLVFKNLFTKLKNEKHSEIADIGI